MPVGGDVLLCLSAATGYVGSGGAGIGAVGKKDGTLPLVAAAAAAVFTSSVRVPASVTSFHWSASWASYHAFHISAFVVSLRARAGAVGMDGFVVGRGVDDFGDRFTVRRSNIWSS